MSHTLHCYSVQPDFSNWVGIWRTWNRLWTNPAKLDLLDLAPVLLSLSCCQTIKNCWCRMTPGTPTRPCCASWRNTSLPLKFLLQVVYWCKCVSCSPLLLLIVYITLAVLLLPMTWIQIIMWFVFSGEDLLPGGTQAFSSYPGSIFSGDDFYILSSGLVRTLCTRHDRIEYLNIFKFNNARWSFWFLIYFMCPGYLGNHHRQQ